MKKTTAPSKAYKSRDKNFDEPVEDWSILEYAYYVSAAKLDEDAPGKEGWYAAITCQCGLVEDDILLTDAGFDWTCPRCEGQVICHARTKPQPEKLLVD